MKRFTVIAMAVVALVACFAVAGCGQAAGSADNAITVSASGSANITPDKADLVVFSKAEGSTSDELSANADKVANEIIAHLKTAGVDESKITSSKSEAKTTTVSGSSQVVEEATGYYDWDGNWVDTGVEQYYVDGGTQTGYETTLTIKAVDIDVSALNSAIREAAAAGATGFGELTYKVGDRDAAYQAALSVAVDAAHTKAEALAKASGVYVGRVVNMLEDTSAADLNLSVAGDTSKLDVKNVASLELAPTEIPVSAGVTVSYAIS